MLWREGGRAAPETHGLWLQRTPWGCLAPWRAPEHAGGREWWRSLASSCTPVCSFLVSLHDAGDAWMEDAVRPILCAVKHLPGRCHMQCVTCPCSAHSGEDGMGSWLTGAWQGGSLGFWVLVWGCTYPSTHRGWCKLTLLPARLCPEKRGWGSAIPAGSVLGVCVGLRGGVLSSTQSCCESFSLEE